MFSSPDEVIYLNKDVQKSLPQICQKIAQLSRIREIHKDICKKLNKKVIIGKSSAMKELICKLPRYADSDVTILLTGETGTGKELFARAFHYLGKRSGKPFITVDCSALPENLAENELFGHYEEAFTGAQKKKKGLIEEADNGTVFFDEIEALSLNLQKKLLRFIQEREIKSIGSNIYKKIDTRIIAASNEDLQRLVKEKKFRKDLFYRLNVAGLCLPPVRERQEDILPLVNFFLKKQSNDRSNIKDVPKKILNSWIQYGWPGNIREIENTIHKWLLNRDDLDFSYQSELPIISDKQPESDLVQPLKEFRTRIMLKHERNYLINLLKFTQNNISEAAKLACIHRKNLSNLIKKYGIDLNIFNNILLNISPLSP